MSMSSSLQAVLTGAVSGKIQWNAPLSALTTFRVGGPADALVTLLDSAELQAVLDLCHREQITWKIVGRGSNILASDDGFRGIIVVLGDGFKQIDIGNKSNGRWCEVRAGGGVGLARLADWCAGHGLSGVEFAAGIPGTVGGAVAMNAGAWGREMADVIVSIELTDRKGVRELDRTALSFGYRRCDNLAGDTDSSVVSAASLRLKKEATEQILSTMSNLLQKRRERQPLGLASGGSVFRNPAGDSAGRLIDAAGLKGVRVGGAEVSDKHANFIVNRGGASAEDIRSLIAQIQHQVKTQSGVELIPEIEFI